MNATTDQPSHTKPTVVLVHGAFADSAYTASLVSQYRYPAGTDIARSMAQRAGSRR